MSHSIWGKRGVESVGMKRLPVRRVRELGRNRTRSVDQAGEVEVGVGEGVVDGVAAGGTGAVVVGWQVAELLSRGAILGEISKIGLIFLRC